MDKNDEFINSSNFSVFPSLKFIDFSNNSIGDKGLSNILDILLTNFYQ